MLGLHRGLGEAIVIVYLGIAIASWILARRDGLPSWLTGIAHTLLGIQVIIGIVLFVQHPHAVPWTHVLFGGLAVLSLGLMAPLRRRFGRGPAIGITSLVVGVFALVAVTIAVTSVK
ncbi:MAG TPA: hypothetical protein VFN57_12235 [Thermomicrobiaceae bacterium]|nr:hypothetical protein [Thermomicrobiaceae bacterium]